MKCAEIDEDVLDEVILGRCQDAGIQWHLIDCPRCAEYFRSYQGTVANIRAAFAPPDPNRTLHPQEIRNALVKRANETSAQAKEASRTFSRIMRESFAGLPHAERIQRIHQASRELSIARCEVLQAHKQLNDFNSRGVIPDGLTPRSE